LTQNSGLIFSVVSLVSLALSGCALRMGPKIVAHDRFDYSSAVARSQQEQMLVNMVRVRYLEPPSFMDISQVVAQYSFVGEATAHVADWKNATTGVSANALGRWTESPTVTYSPLTGERFIKSLLQPVSPVTLFSLVQAGWPVDSVMSIGVRAINGLHAGTRTGLMKHQGDAEFYRLLALLRAIQVAGALGIRVEDHQGGATGTLVFRANHPDAVVESATQGARKLLGVPAETNEFPLRFGTVSKEPGEVVMLTRSMMEILYESAAGVQVPDSDLEEKRATRPLSATGSSVSDSLMITVRSSAHKPPSSEAETAVNYRGHWFWVSDRDLQSKGGLSFLLTLFTLAGSGTTAAPPVLTLSRP
jgi:hypothetical protein